MRLIEKVWFNKHPAKFWLVPLLLPVSLLFWLISTIRRFCYQRQILPSFSTKAPIIVVGNIGIGGNGKTPLVILLVKLCQQLGLTPGIISRGYGSKAPHYPYLLTPQSSAIESGDEPLLLFQRCGVPVVIGADRIANADLLMAKGCNILIADDGLQHYRMKRAIELIVIDAKRMFGNGLLLPAGPLREGKWRLNTVDFVVGNGELNKTFALSCDQQKLLTMNLQASVVCHLLTGKSILLSEFLKQNQAINAIAGIGSPERFFDTLTNAKFNIKQQQGFIDHHDFKQQDFSDFDDKLPLLMTEKDAVKCQSFALEHWWYLPVDAIISQQQLELLQTKIQQLTRA